MSDRLPTHIPAGSIDQASARAAQIRAGADGALVEAMAEAAFTAWRELMGIPSSWKHAHPADANVTRVGIHAALLAARAHAKAKRNSE